MLTFQFSCSDTAQWARDNFIGARLNDPRRQRRAVRIAQAMANFPGKTIPMMFANPNDAKKTYEFFDREECTPDNLQMAHRRRTLEQMRQLGQTNVIAEDTSDFSYSGKRPIQGAGPISTGEEGLQGFRVHTALAARWPSRDHRSPEGRRPPMEILGLADQTFHVRDADKKKVREETRWERWQRERETQVWEHTTDRLGPAPRGVRWVRVCDREADIYEFLDSCQKAGHGFVVRVREDRRLVDPDTMEEMDKVFETSRQTRPLGQFNLPLRGREGAPERVARLSASATPVALRSPLRPGHPLGSRPPIRCTVVRVWEAKPPKDQEPLEWLLYCDQQVTTFEEAHEVSLQYSCRWLIEEYHKAIKTGMGAERLQLETASRLFAAIAIMNVVALRLLDLRERVRINPDGPAQDAGLSDVELRVLRAHLNRSIETVRDVALAVGRLGGHMNRKADGMPGWLTLWRGMQCLLLLTQGFLLSLKVMD